MLMRVLVHMALRFMLELLSALMVLGLGDGVERVDGRQALGLASTGTVCCRLREWLQVDAEILVKVTRRRQRALTWVQHDWRRRVRVGRTGAQLALAHHSVWGMNVASGDGVFKSV